MIEKLSRRDASDRVIGQGWRYVLGVLCTTVPVRSLAQAAEVAACAVGAAGARADRHLRLDLRADRVILSLQALTGAAVTTVDPLGQGPAIWFQQMDVPRPQRNRIHLDISVPHDEAAGRIDAALAAGGRLVSDVAAPAFWVLADTEGNEACITTWQGRDPPSPG